MSEEVLLRNLTIYRNEIWSITISILNQRDKLFNSEVIKRCQDPNNHVLDPHPEPHEIIANILNCAGRLQKLFVIASQRKDESDEEFEFRKERSEYLKQRFLAKKSGNRELFKTNARNSMEHFDERTDLLMNNLIEKNGNIDGKFLLYNMTLNNKDLFKPWDLVLPIKVLVTSSMEYFIVNNKIEKEQISLNKLFEEVEKIQLKIVNYVEEHFEANSPDRQGPVGVWFPINNKQ